MQYINSMNMMKALFWFTADVVMRKIHRHLVVDGVELRVAADVEGEENLWGRFRVAMGEWHRHPMALAESFQRRLE